MAEKWERWTITEIAILKQHYSNMPRDDLMQLLPGRTWRAIYHIAEKQKVHRNWRDIPLSEEEIVALHTRLSIARSNRTGQPFAGNHHTAEAKLAISVSNLLARGHSIEDIADRHQLTYPQLSRIIQKRDKKRRKTQ